MPRTPAQHPNTHPRSRDFYHTCYCLSGLAIAQHFGSGDLHHEVVLGVPENRLVGAGHRRELPGQAGLRHPASTPPEKALTSSLSLAAAHAPRLQHRPGKGGESGDALLAAACAQPGAGGHCGLGVPLPPDCAERPCPGAAAASRRRRVERGPQGASNTKNQPAPGLPAPAAAPPGIPPTSRQEPSWPRGTRDAAELLASINQNRHLPSPVRGEGT